MADQTEQLDFIGKVQTKTEKKPTGLSPLKAK